MLSDPFNLMLVLTAASTIVALVAIAFAIVRMTIWSSRTKLAYAANPHTEGTGTVHPWPERPQRYYIRDTPVLLTKPKDKELITQFVLELDPEGLEYTKRVLEYKQERYSIEQQRSEEK